ncbi:N-acetyltransferase ESCO2-like [Halichondria panicea]|uniref:N-acetyltransferase ESCO2-like n=1 Tax=Halichondria panicea TaxID=6063 RepID=UPI00312BB231
MATRNISLSKEQILTSPRQLGLCLLKLKTSPVPVPVPTPSSSPHAADLIDLLNENPLSSPDLSQSFSVKSRQTDILSFLSGSQSETEQSPNEWTPLAQGTETDSVVRSSKSSRALFPSIPTGTKPGQKNQRKRKLSNTSEGKPRAVKRKKKEDMDQMQLDCGQKLLGHVTCKLCGMVYTHTQLDDQVEHSRFHSRFVAGVNFPGWKNERVVAILEFGRIIMVLPSESKQHSKKMEDIQALVDHDLGYSVSPGQAKRVFTVFLCVAKRKIMGCVFTERIKQGYEVLCDESSSFDNLTAWYSSNEPQPAVLGINRLWVAANCRRMGVASKLLNSARSCLIPGSVIPKDKMAFTDPTPDGKLFASHYCGRTNFLVYR